MTVSMNSVGLNQNTAFKGSHKRTEAGVPYYHTTAGTTAGAVLAVPAFAMNFSSGKLLNKIAEFIKKHAPEEAAKKRCNNLSKLLI